MDKNNDGKADKPPAKDPETAPETPPETPSDSPDAAGELGDLMDALRAKGLTISPKVMTLRELIIAVESTGDADGAGDDDGTGGNAPPDQGTGGTTSAGTAPMLMSTTSTNAEHKALAKSWAVPAVAELKKSLADSFKSGRITRVEAEEKKRVIEGAREMSFDPASGKVISPLVAMIAEVAARPANSAWKASGDGVDLSATTTPVLKPAKLAEADGGTKAAAVEAGDDLGKMASRYNAT